MRSGCLLLVGTGRVWALSRRLPAAWVPPALFLSAGTSPTPGLPPSVLVSPLLGLSVSVAAFLPLHLQ